MLNYKFIYDCVKAAVTNKKIPHYLDDYDYCGICENNDVDSDVEALDYLVESELFTRVQTGFALKV